MIVECIIKDIQEVFQYIPYALASGALFGLIYLVVFRFVIRRPVVLYRCMTGSLLIAYISLMLQIAFFSREPGSRVKVSLHLFETWTQDPQGRAYVIENILLFIPFAILLYLFLSNFGKRLIYLVPPAGVLLSCVIEFMQLITERGYFQVDDIFTNTVGTLIGFLICFCLHLARRHHSSS